VADREGCLDGGTVGLCCRERTTRRRPRYTRRDDECEQNETPRLNTNTRRGAHRIDQHAVRIARDTTGIDQDLIALGDPALLGTLPVTRRDPAITAHKGGTPAEVRFIAVFTRYWGRKAPERRAAIAHELGHATNLRHHAFDRLEVGVRYWTSVDGGIVESGSPVRIRADADGRDLSRLLAARLSPGRPHRVWIGGRYGTNSGSETCLMRYTNAEAYLSYTAPNERFYVLDPDPELRASFCTSRDGTTFNAPLRTPQTRFDSATLGLCRADLRVRDR
jgi:hypothetical protein